MQNDKNQRIRQFINFAVLFALLLFTTTYTAYAQTTAFTYQGKLTDAGNPATGSYDMQFKLFDTVTVGTGTQQGVTLTNPTVAVSTGLFTVTLDFGTNVFTGAARYLEIGVRPAGSANPYTVLAPRQAILATPYAIQTINAIGTTGTFSFAGIAAPAVAPAGQGRLYFDTATNKLKVSESGGAFVNLVGAGGVSGSGTTNTIPLWSAGTTLGNSLITQSSGNIGIGISNPTNQLHVLSSTAGVPAIYGESATSRGVWGKSVSSRGVYGESSSGEAVFGISNSGSGIYGESAATNTLTFSGVAGRATGSGGTAVAGLATGSGAFGVYGESATGRAVYGKSVSSRGVYGESSNGEGVYGISNLATGVFGISTSASGVGGYFQNNAGGTALKVDGSGAIIFNGTGNVGIGTSSPNTRLTLSGGTAWTSAGWTASMNLQNISAFGWEANASGQRFGIGQSTGGLYFFRTNSGFGSTSSPANYDMTISDAGNVGITGNATQSRDKGGFVKAMIYVAADGTIVRCYNGITNSSTGNCGFSVTQPTQSNYEIDFGFRVDDRFVSITPQTASSVRIAASYLFISTNVVVVSTYITDVDYDYSDAANPFMLIVY